jgi:hypothetical protein
LRSEVSYYNKRYGFVKSMPSWERPAYAER